MGAFVNLQILRSGENLSTAGKHTGERFLAGMHSDMVDQFIFGFEGSTISGASLPKASVGCALGSSDVIHGQMADDITHAGERFAAGFPSAGLLIDP